MTSDYKNIFISLVRLGIVSLSETLTGEVDWQALKVLSARQGLGAVVIDGIGRLPHSQRPPKELLLQWIADVMQKETRFSVQQKRATEIASLFHLNGIRTYVLKGTVVSECYPKPEHRVSSDLDCYLLPDNDDFDAWRLGNELIESEGYKVDTDYYKNSTFHLPGLTVESHRFMTPFRGNNKLRALEIMLQGQIKEDKVKDRFDGSWLFRPPVMVTALFLIEHAYSHFLHEGLTWRLILDWMMFSRRHSKQIDWNTLNAEIDEFGFRKFYDSYERLGRYLLGEMCEDELTADDNRMLADVWDDLDLHKTVKGLKGKLALAGNTWRARWKYHYFADISMLRALWIQVKGFLFIKEPKLD